MDLLLAGSPNVRFTCGYAVRAFGEIPGVLFGGAWFSIRFAG